MGGETQNLRATLGGNNIESGVSDQPRILQILPKEDLKETDYVVLGENENAFIALPKQVTTRIAETLPNSDIEIHSEKQKFLLIVNDQGVPKYQTLVFEIPKLDEDTSLGDLSALEEFKALIAERHCEEGKKCLFDDKSRTLTYGQYITHTATKRDIGGVKIEEKRHRYLQDSTSEEINRLVALNKKAQAAIPSAA